MNPLNSFLPGNAEDDPIVMTAEPVRRKYENFYESFREYLWPYRIIADLAELEVEAYKAFFDKDKLISYVEKLRKPVEEVAEEFEDELLKKRFDELRDILDIVDQDHLYEDIGIIEEVDPNEDKQDEQQFENEEDRESKFTEPEEREGM